MINKQLHVILISISHNSVVVVHDLDILKKLYPTREVEFHQLLENQKYQQIIPLCPVGKSGNGNNNSESTCNLIRKGFLYRYQSYTVYNGM